MTAVWNVFEGAVHVLVGAGPVKQRLIDAWRDHLAPVHEKDLPEALRARLATLRDALHAARPTGGMTAAEVAVRKMSEKEAAEHAVRIVEIFAQLAATQATPRLRVVAAPPTDANDDLPAFLSRA